MVAMCGVNAILGFVLVFVMVFLVAVIILVLVGVVSKFFFYWCSWLV